jgi:hypothetical protein
MALVVVLTSLAAVACAAGPKFQPPELPAGSADCSVTQPAPPADVPQAVIDTIGRGSSDPSLPSRADFTGWYGNDELWVYIYPDGARRDEKFPWVRLAQGRLTITGHRADGAGGLARSAVPDGYGDVGFQASGIEFPSAGCWQITGTVANQPLTFVTRVQ